jgi:citrate lyase beta subunit
MRPRRALLFIPGDSQRDIKKATTLDVDCVIIDLEDNVAWNKKEAARTTTLEALKTLDFGHSERVVRINPVGSRLEDADLRITSAGGPDAYLLPKVETPAQLIWLDKALTTLEHRHDFAPDSIRILALVETALGIMNLREIAQASRRVDALMFGAEDLIGNIGVVRTPAGSEVHYARSKVVTAAAAFELQAIDMAYVNIGDSDGLKAECHQAVELGYRGKMAVHPNQIPVIQTAFSPTPEQIAAAQRLIEAYESYQVNGSGVFTLDGAMMDASLIRAAEQVLIRSETVKSF